MAVMAKNIQSAATGVPVTETIDFSQVRLRDGTMVTPRNILTTTESGQGVVSVYEQELVQAVLPGEHDITDGIVKFCLQSFSILNFRLCLLSCLPSPCLTTWRA